LQKQMDFITNNAPFTFSFMIASMRRRSISKEGRSAHKPFVQTIVLLQLWESDWNLRCQLFW
jgi:hypothetical protein